MINDADSIIEKKKRQAIVYAARNGGWLTRKEFACIAEIHVSSVSRLLRDLNFGPIIKKKTGCGRGPVKIPLDTVISYIEKTFIIE